MEQKSMEGNNLWSRRRPRRRWVTGFGRVLAFVLLVLAVGLAGPVGIAAAFEEPETAPEVTLEPNNEEVNESETAWFRATAAGSPEPTIQWQVSTDGGQHFENLPGATADTLPVENATLAENGYVYRAVFTNRVDSETSTQATLTVDAPARVTSSPSDQTVLVGEAVSFTAAATGSPAPGVQWERSTSGGKFSAIPGPGGTSPTLTIEHAALSESGNRYRARFKNSLNEAISEAATLTVHSPPSITTQPVSVEVAEPASATFTAGASGSPVPTVQWEVSTDAGSTFSAIPGATSGTYKVEPTTVSQSGREYRAVFMNAAGGAESHPATLTVNADKVPSVTTQPVGKTVLAGSTVTFTAKASGTPEPTAQWEFSSNEGKTWEQVPGATSDELKIENATTGQSGDYMAVFKNAVGEAKSAPATLTVDARPAANITSPVNESATKNESQTVEGTANTGPGDLQTVTVKLYEGATMKEGQASLETHASVKVTSGHWSTTFAPLKNGSYIVQAEQTAEGGLFPERSAPVAFRVSTTPPQVTLTSPTGATPPSTTGSEAFAGAAGTEPGDSTTITLRVYEGSTTGGRLAVPPISVPASGNTWSTTVERLKNGTYTAQAEQPDNLGNVGRSLAVTFTVAKPPPSVAIASPVNESSTSSASEPVSGTAATGTGELPQVTVKIFAGTAIKGQASLETHTVPDEAGHWATSFGKLAGGTYTVQAEQTDEFGNLGTSAPVKFTVTTTAPPVTLTSPLSKSSSNSGSVTFAGADGSATGDSKVVNLNIYEGQGTEGPLVKIVPVKVSGETWSTTVALRNGAYTAQAEQSDELGHVGVSLPVSFTVAKPLPLVAISSPANGSSTAQDEQSVAGTASTGSGFVPTATISIFAGATIEGQAPLESHSVSVEANGHLGETSFGKLKRGTYTLLAEQSDNLGNIGRSAPVSFTVTTTPPAVTLTSPASGSSFSPGPLTFAGTAGTATGDFSTVTLDVYEGSTTAGHLARTSLVGVSAGHWSASIEGLKSGTYTARAQQSDEIGNVGISAPSTFMIITPQPVVGPPPPPPAASFTWFPANPHVGERVSLASNSTDAASPITASAWDLQGNGPFATPGSVVTTSFSTVGPHVVRLRVSDANGQSSIATQTILVTATPMTLMQPFPIVRIAGTDSRAGVKLSLLSVLAPVGTLTTVSCRGRGCPAGAESRVSVTNGSIRKTGAVATRFRRFERSLRAGVVLEIRVSTPGAIGKYTRFVVRHGKLPVRIDQCVASTDPKPLPCPSS